MKNDYSSRWNGKKELTERNLPPPTVCQTTKPLVFNNPDSGTTYQIPAGTRCIQVHTVNEAEIRGYLRKDDKNGHWAATTNLQRGYILVWLEGTLRGVSLDDIYRVGASK